MEVSHFLDWLSWLEEICSSSIDGWACAEWKVAASEVTLERDGLCQRVGRGARFFWEGWKGEDILDGFRDACQWVIVCLQDFDNQHILLFMSKNSISRKSGAGRGGSIKLTLGGDICRHTYSSSPVVM